MFSKKKPMVTRILASLLAILMVTYNIPAGMIIAGYAATTPQDVFTLKVLNEGTPVADQTVTVHNANNEITLSGKTDINGDVQFSDLSTSPFGSNNNFEFTVGSNTFTKMLAEGTTDHLTFEVTKNKLTAPTYFVTVNQNISGKVTVNGQDFTVPVQVPAGTDVPLVITPKANYEITTVKINGETQPVPNKQRYTDQVFAISADTTINVEYALVKHTITFNTNNFGTIEDVTGKVINSLPAEHNSTPSFTAVPNEGYHIQSLEIDGTPVSLPADVTQATKNYPYTFTDGITTDRTVKVTFAINTYAFTATVTGGHGTVSPETATVNYNKIVDVTITPAEKYRVAAVTMNGTSVDVEQLKDNDDGTYTFTTPGITQPTNLVVTFEAIPPLTGPWSQYVSVEPSTGSLAKSLYKDGNNQILIFSNGAELSVKAVSPYLKLSVLLSGFPLFDRWKTEYRVTSETSISGLQVKQNSKKSQGLLDLGGTNLLLLFDTKKPVVDPPAISGDSLAAVAGSDWYSGNVTVSGTITNGTDRYSNIDYKSDIDKVYYSKGGYSPADAKVAYDSADPNNTNTADPIHYSFQPTDEDYSGKYSIWAVDKAGNRSDIQSVDVNIDKTIPDLSGKEAVTFTQVNDNFFAKALNKLTFGAFFKKGVEVTVHAEDGGSGVKEISLIPKSADKSDLVPAEVSRDFSKDGRTAVETFKLDTEKFKGTFDVKLTDHVGNNQTLPVTDANSNIKNSSGVVMIENTPPTAKITVTPKTLPGGTPVSLYENNGISIYNGDVTFGFTVGDADSGVNTVKIDVNDVEKYKVNDFSNEQQNNPAIDSFSTTDLLNGVKINPDGSYNVKVYVIDNAGNTFTTEKTMYLDTKGPEITHFTFEPDIEGDILDSVEPTDYGFYFKNKTLVKVSAEDKKAENEAASGVQHIAVYVKDYEKNQYFAVNTDGTMSPIAEADKDKVTPITTTDNVTFTIPENFKGQIFAKATDYVNNTGELKSPTGTVVENAQQHEKSADITLDKEKTTYKDNTGLDLYAKNVPVNVKVTDSYSGIAKIEWSVVAPYDKANNQGGTVLVDNNKGVSGDIDGWNVAKTDQNLITEMTKQVVVSNDSNGIVLHVKLTDRVGNVSEKEVIFSIDKTAPTMTVIYDNNTPDKQYTDYYKEDRTATIVVTERNFRPEDVVHEITNNGGGIPKLVGWTTADNAQDPNKTTHTATIHYSEDGDYTFNIKYKDNAENLAAPVAQQNFTLDKTIPVINVAYNNNAVSNGNYYKAARTATITIKEHNFDPARVKVAGSATDNGNAAGFPGTSGWSSNGDTHTATIHYVADGKYLFDIDFMDKAGNISADYKTEQFVVDQTAPALTISGVKNLSANKGDVVPVISYSDTNFNRNAVSIKLTGANHGAVKPDGSLADAANGQVFTFKNFAKDKKVDDIYTLTANLVDFAGNQSTETVRFSVNRFGSVYVFDDALKAIEGKYVKHEKDVVLTETNVDTLKSETIKVKMTKNGTPTDLVQGKDYTVSHSGGGDKWSQYKYVVNKGLFADDGKYSVALYSEDAAGNINENIDETKKAEISFGIDKTAPVIIPVDFASGQQYPVEKKDVSVSVKDNLVLAGAKVYLNGKKIAHKADGENYSFSIPSSNSKQDVKIVAVDAAGNQHVTAVNDFLVSTNPIVRWYNNTPLFMGSLGGVGVVGALAVFLAAKKMRKEEEDK